MLYFWLWTTQHKCCISGCGQHNSKAVFLAVARYCTGVFQISFRGKTQNDTSYFNSACHIIKVAELWRMRWSGHVARVRLMRNEQTILAGKLQVKHF
jgi:hypothetical protein